MTEIGTSESPLRVAIVGSGPSGFYAAGHLLKAKDLTVQVDMYDRLPTPWGLVRGGVAPDHPNIKAVSRVYEKTAAHPEFRFYGNVEFGSDLTHDELTDRYHAIIYAVGAQTDKQMGIPGEDLPGSWAATELVAWYNGHPDYVDLEFDLSGKRIAVIGNGNVAMDVARMLALTRDELAVTDVADHALEQMAESGIEEIYVLGRRGPAQAAFTNPEILEIGELTDADVVIDPADVELDEASRDFLESDASDLTARKNVEILTGYSERQPAGKPKRVHFRFLVSPLEIVGEGKVEAIKLARNRLVAQDGQIRAEQTEETETLPVDLVFRSIGYRGVPLDGVPFDEARGTIPNDGARVLEGDAPVRGEYVTGWIKRGPSGVIGTNKKDAQDTVDAVLADLAADALLDPSDPVRESLEALLAERKPDVVSYAGWEAIDAHEKGLGEPQGRPRVKLCRVEELLEVAAQADKAPA
jgi:ferredoxin--NADP+ reductase